MKVQQERSRSCKCAAQTPIDPPPTTNSAREDSKEEEDEEERVGKKKRRIMMPPARGTLSLSRENDSRPAYQL